MQIEIYRWITWLWLGTFAVWWISAIAAKRTVGSDWDWQSHVVNSIVGLAWVLLFDGQLGGPLAWRFLPMEPVVTGLGFALTVAGLGLALLARFDLGSNWGALVELKQNHQLVRSGPYALVRHPIYSGFMLATLGTAIAHGQLRGLIAFAVVAAAWTYKSGLEETFLLRHFGPVYEQYRREVKRLIPFVW